MTQKRIHYSKQFKVDAVKLVTEQGYNVSEAARNPLIHDRHLDLYFSIIKCDPDVSGPFELSIRISLSEDRWPFQDQDPF